jgi:hypothetical protein
VYNPLPGLSVLRPVSGTCPPTPDTVADAAGNATTSRDAAQAVAWELDLAPDDSGRHRRLALEFAERLADVTRGDEWLRETMRRYGGYLHHHGVLPQHFVICVRAAMDHICRPLEAEHDQIVTRAIGWTIEGYYEARAPSA